MSTINGTAGDDQLQGTSGNDTINGLDGNDILYGAGGDDTLNGGNGNDDLEGGAGNDHLNGDAGYDFASYIVATSGVTVSLAITTAQNTVGAGTDTLSGIEGLIGSDFNDSLTGNSGDNLLDGRGGKDTLIGGAGNDILQISSQGDYVAGEKYDGGDGYDALVLSGTTGDTDLSTSTVVNFEELDAQTTYLTVAASQLNGLQVLQAATLDINTAGVANMPGAQIAVSGIQLDVGGITLNLAGATGSTVVNGSSGADTVTGGLDIINIYGKGGNDTLTGGAGDDFIQGDDGSDHVNGGDGKDVLAGNAGDDVITGGAGDDVITGDDDFSQGNDTISGGDGNDQINGNGGTDTINGDAGDDVIHGNGTLSGGDGNDAIDGNGTLSGGLGNDRLSANSGTNHLSGDDGDDVLTGGTGADTLDGGDGNDSLDGLGGANTLHGDGGNDTLYVEQNDVTVDGGDGDDLIVVAGTSLPGGTTITGGAGIDTLRLDDTSFDLTSATLNHDIEGIIGKIPYFVLTAKAAQLDGLKMLEVDTVHVTTGGSIDLSGAALSVNHFNLSAATTLNFADSTGIMRVDGSSGSDKITGGDGGGVITGENGDDVLTAGSGGMVLDGGAGNDILNGGSGNDLLQDGSGKDFMNGGGGDDQIYIRSASEMVAGEQYLGGSGTDTLFVQFSGDISKITIGTDIEKLDAHFETLTLTAAQLATFTTSIDATAIHLSTGGVVDLSQGQVTAMEIDLAAADTKISLPASASGAANYIVVGSDGNDQITGGAKDDILKGGNGNDTLHGGDGNDQLYGGAGIDILDGGNGNDILYVESADDLTNGTQFLGGDGIDWLQLRVDNLDISNTILSSIEEVSTFGTVSMTAAQLGGLQIVSAPNLHVTTGGTVDLSGANVLVGNFYLNDAGNTLYLPTADRNYNVFVEGGAGNDTVTGGYYYGEYFGNGGDDTLDVSNVAFDFDLDGGDGNDTLTGNVHDNRLYGGAGDDTLVANSGGNDTVSGGDGNDTIRMGAMLTSADRIDGGAGADTVWLYGDYSGLAFSATTMVNVETLVLGSTHSYRLTSNDATVAAGQTLTVNGAGLKTTDSMIFDGSAETNGDFVFLGGAGNDVLTGGAGADQFDLSKGGDDTALGGSGNDSVAMGAVLTASDRIDGGAGTDTLSLNGDYSAGLTFSATTMVNVEMLSLAAGHSYSLSLNNANVAAGQTLTVNASALGAGNALIFDGSAETDGRFAIAAGSGNDALTGGAGADQFDLSKGGNDTAFGGAGNDTFVMGAALTAADHVDGGAGTDTLSLNGDYSAGLVFSSTTMTNVETLQLTAGHSYTLTTSDATVAAGQTLTVNAKPLGHSDALIFDGSAEHDGSFVVTGGSGNDSLTGGTGRDTLTGGNGDDRLTGGGGGDHLTGGQGHNSFIYGSVGESTGPGFDTISHFNVKSDTIDLWFAVSGLDHAVSGGTLTSGNFDADLAAALSSTQLGANHAVLFAPSSGDYIGETFLVVDANGIAGYQAGQDLVIEFDGTAHLDHFKLSDFAVTGGI